MKALYLLYFLDLQNPLRAHALQDLLLSRHPDESDIISRYLVINLKKVHLNIVLTLILF